MFILDSLFISGLRWTMDTVIKAAEAEMNDDTALREALLEAEMRREMGEISDEEFGEIEADLLARIREIKERREGAGALAFGGAQPMETSPDSRFQVEASVSGDFYDPADAPHTTIVETEPVEHHLANLVQTSGEETIEVLDMQPGAAAEPTAPSLPLSPDRSKGSRGAKGSNRSRGSLRSARTTRTARTARTTRTTRTARTK
jgi:hypothetical protein